jgi:hypothetical protein
MLLFASMKKIAAALAFLLLTAAHSGEANPWQAWAAGSEKKCPTQHPEWMGDGGYEDFILAFEQSLAENDRRRLIDVADARQQCASEQIGFTCEMGRELAAAQRLGLLDRLIEFGCRTVKCEEGAICTRMPRPVSSLSSNQRN